MSAVSATRINLMNRREQVRTAGEGVRLLKNKREALLRDFIATADTALTSRGELERRCREAGNTLTLALAMDGAAELRSAGMAAGRELELRIRERRVWGISLPEIRYRSPLRSPDARGYGLAGTGLSVDETASAFERVLEQALQMAVEEVRLRRLGGEIRKTSRRVNALEQILLPSLSEEIRRIVGFLEERAREDLFRLKRLKKNKLRHRR